MTRKKLLSSLNSLFVATAGTALLSLGTVAQAATIDTTTGWLGTGYIFGGSRFGQVFTVPNDNLLDSFTFFLNSTGSPPTEFTARLAPWEPTTLKSGTDIYSSAVQSVAGLPPYTGTPSGYGEVTFNTGGISLVPGQLYVAYLNVETEGAGAIGYNFDRDSYSEGYGLYYSLAQGFWYNNGDPHDYAFKASFSRSSTSVPEPSTVFGLLIFSLGFLVKRKLESPNL